MAVTRDPMKGRHAVGQQLARPGSIRGGQSEPAGNKGGGITASRTAMRPTQNVLSNQAETSSTAQRVVKQPPGPFQNPLGSLNVPAPTHKDYRSTGGAKEQNYEIKSGASIHNGTSLSKDEMAALGYGPNDTKGDWSIISGHATKNNQRQAGRPGKSNQNTSAKENARMRQRPGGF